MTNTDKIITGVIFAALGVCAVKTYKVWKQRKLTENIELLDEVAVEYEK